jgi:hypothetical protein
VLKPDGGQYAQGLPTEQNTATHIKVLAKIVTAGLFGAVYGEAVLS